MNQLFGLQHRRSENVFSIDDKTTKRQNHFSFYPQSGQKAFNNNIYIIIYILLLINILINSLPVSAKVHFEKTFCRFVVLSSSNCLSRFLTMLSHFPGLLTSCGLYWLALLRSLTSGWHGTGTCHICWESFDFIEFFSRLSRAKVNFALHSLLENLEFSFLFCTFAIKDCENLKLQNKIYGHKRNNREPD
jgi:hypothetical protein